jgi:hypothetical protein
MRPANFPWQISKVIQTPIKILVATFVIAMANATTSIGAQAKHVT